jgi:hypothetical protein
MSRNFDQDFNAVYVGTSITLLSLSYVARVAVVFSPASSWLQKNLSRTPRGVMKSYLQRFHQNLLEKPKSKIRLISTVYYKILHSLFVLFVLASDLYSSALWEVRLTMDNPKTVLIFQITWSVFVLFWGSAHIFVARSVGLEANLAVIKQENTWAYGQVLALLLLGLPFISLYELIYGNAPT